MKARFGGDYEKLQQRLAETGIPGEWRQNGNHFQYRADNGAVLNWWKSTGTVTFQGDPDAAVNVLEAAFLKATVGYLAPAR